MKLSLQIWLCDKHLEELPQYYGIDVIDVIRDKSDFKHRCFEPSCDEHARNYVVLFLRLSRRMSERGAKA